MQRRFSWLAAILYIMTAVHSSLMRASIVSALQDIFHTVNYNLKQEIVPPGVQQNWQIVTNSSIPFWLRVLSLYALTPIFGLRYLPALCEFSVKERLNRQKKLQPLSNYKNPHFPFIKEMAQEMDLDPKTIYVGECDEDDMARIAASVTRTFTKNILLIDQPQESQEKSLSPSIITHSERRFLLGHELAHIKYHHILKEIGISIIAPWLVRASLIVTHSLIRQGITALVDRFNLQGNRIVNTVSNFSRFMLRTPLMEALWTNRFVTNYLRNQEKQADIISAKKFNCARHGIQLFKKLDMCMTKKYSRLRRIVIQFFDTHPSNTDRIRYLTEIAQQQSAVPAS